MSIKNLFRIVVATAGLVVATMAQAVTCQFIGTPGGSWDVPANWANCTGGNGVPANTPGPGDRAEITANTVALPVGTINVGDLYMSNSTIQGSFVGSSTLNVLDASATPWGGGSYTFLNLTAQFNTTAGLGLDASTGIFIVNSSVVGLASGATVMKVGSMQITGTGAIFKNASTFLAIGPLISSSGGEFDNEPGGVYSSQTISIDGPFVNKGTFTLNFGGVVTLNSAAQFSQPSGSSGSISGNGTLSGPGQTLTLDGGFVSMNPTLSFAGVVNNGAVIQPGGPGAIGTTTINGNYTHGVGAGLEIEVTFNSTVIVYDKLVVSGLATISPATSVVFNYINTGFGAYNTTQGDVLNFMTFGNLSGSFGGFSAPATANSTSLAYTSTQAQFVVGPVIGPILSVTGSGSFPITAVGATSGVQTITITNTGIANLVLSSISASNPLVFSDTLNGPPPQAAQWCGFGSDPMGFPIPTGGPITLAPAATCQLVLNFKPTAAITYNETVTISSNDPTSPKVIALSGTGAIGATATLAPDPLNFGNVNVGSQSAPLTATFTNTSATPLTPTSINVGPDFNVVGGTCAVGVAVAGSGGTCTIDGTALPSVAASLGSALQVVTTPLSNNPQVVVQVVGVAPPTVSLTVNPIVMADTPVNWTRALFVGVYNSGLSPVTFSAPTITGAPQFSVGVNQVPSCMTGTIPADTTCSFIFNFTPTSLGSFSGTFSVSTSAGNLSAPISGNGIATIPFPTASAPTLNFPATNIGSSSSLNEVFLNPATGATVQFQVLGGLGGPDAADFVVTSDACNSIFVAPNTNCLITVNFQPISTAGTKSASISYLAVEPSGSFVGIGATLTGTAVVAGAAPAITSPLTASGSVGSAFSYTIAATNAPVSYNATGLSPGLTINTATGVISGVPTASGSFTVALSATNANGTGAGTLTLTVLAPAPAVSLSQTLVAFGNQTANTTSAVTVVTLSNPGAAALFISGITVSGDFGFTSTCPTATAPLVVAASCAISITFTPLSVAALTGTIIITSNAPGSPHTISLTGTGVGTAVPVLTLASASVSFPPTVVGTVSGYQTLQVTNSGLSTLNFSAISVSGPFRRLTGANVPLDCGASLAPAASCLIWLSFNPVFVGSGNGQLSITHNAAGSPALVALTGTGTSLPAPLIAVVAGLAFGDQVINTSAIQALTISNAGTATLNIASVALSGADASSYRQAGSCGSVPAGGTCTLNITFTPASLGSKSALLTIVSDSGSSQVAAVPSVISTVALSGNGIRSPLPVATLNLSIIGFGNSIFGGASTPQAVTLTNTGSAALAISNIVVGADFLQMNNCAGALSSAASCTINVMFSPLGMGARSGELQVFSNAGGSPHKVTLSGTGCRWFSQAQSRFFLTTC